jgi:hypothetical protein
MFPANVSNARGLGRFNAAPRELKLATAASATAMQTQKQIKIKIKGFRV